MGRAKVSNPMTTQVTSLFGRKNCHACKKRAEAPMHRRISTLRRSSQAWVPIESIVFRSEKKEDAKNSR